MALQYVVPDGDLPEKYVVAEARLAWTEDGRLVPETSVDARWFAYPVGARIPLAEAVSGGLVQEDSAPKAKVRRPAGDK